MITKLLHPLKRMTKKTIENIKYNIIPAIGAGILLSILGWLGTTQPPSIYSYIAAVPALVVILLTALARVNDITPDLRGLHWQWRRLGLVLAGATSLTYLLIPFAKMPLYPSWWLVSLGWGFALSWLTTPGMPPWWKYISGEYRKKNGNGDA